MLRLGKILQADVLVLLQVRDKPKPALDVVVCETHQGLRLLTQTLSMEMDGEATAKAVLSTVATGIARSKQPITTIVAVPALACNDLTFEYQHLGAAYARLIEQSLMSRKGTLVVELAEAQAIGKELILGDRSTVARQLPLYLLGEFRNNGQNDSRHTDLHLWLKRAEGEVGSRKQDATPPAQAGETLLKMAQELLDGQGAAPADKPNPELEVQELLALAHQFTKVGQPEEALPLYEASLLLRDQAEGHRGAAESIWAQFELNTYDAVSGAVGQTTEPHEARARRMRTQIKQLLLIGLAHAETFLRMRPDDRESERLLGSYLFLPESSDALVRSLALSDKKHPHVWLWYEACQVIDPLPTLEQRFDFVLRLAPFVCPESEGAFRDLLLRTAGFKDSPELQATLAAIYNGKNEFAAKVARQVPAKVAEWLAMVNSAHPAPKPTVQDAGIMVVRSRFQVPGASGLSKLGASDVFFKRGDSDDGTSSGNFLWAVRNSTAQKADRLCAISGTAARWDGKYFWSLDQNQNQFVVVDPATGRQWTIGPSAGFPADSIDSCSMMPLQPGKMVVGASFGVAWLNPRSWTALISFDPQQGGRVSIFHESKQSPLAKGANRKDGDEEWFPKYVIRLPAKDDPKTALRQIVICVTRNGNKVIQVIGDHATLVQPALQDPLISACQVNDRQGDTLYYLGPTGGNSQSLTLYRTRDPAGPSERLVDGIISEPMICLSVFGSHAYLTTWKGHDEKLQIIDLPHGPIRQVPIDVAQGAGLYQGMSGWICTNYFGTVAQLDENYVEILDCNGQPLTEETLAKGIPLPRKGDLTGVMAEASRLVATYPNDANGWANRAFIKMRMGDLDGAMSDYNQALILNSLNAEALRGRGLLRQARGNFQGALVDLQGFCNATSLVDPLQWYGRIWVWTAQAQLGHKNQANQDLAAFLAGQDPPAPGDWPSKIAAFFLNRITEADLLATANASDAAVRSGNLCEAWYYAGMKQLVVGDKHKATDCFRKCMATKQVNFSEYQSAQLELKSLEK